MYSAGYTYHPFRESFQTDVSFFIDLKQWVDNMNLLHDHEPEKVASVHVADNSMRDKQCQVQKNTKKVWLKVYLD